MPTACSPPAVPLKTAQPHPSRAANRVAPNRPGPWKATTTALEWNIGRRRNPAARYLRLVCDLGRALCGPLLTALDATLQAALVSAPASAAGAGGGPCAAAPRSFCRATVTPARAFRRCTGQAHDAHAASAAVTDLAAARPALPVAPGCRTPGYRTSRGSPSTTMAPPCRPVRSVKC